MKKTIIMTIIIAMMLSVASVVNAATATITTSKTEVKKGEEVTVTVNFGEKMNTSDFVLNYDKSLFKFVSADSEKSSEEGNGVHIGNFMTPKESATVTLKAIAETGKATFSVEPQLFADSKNSEVTVDAKATANVNIKKEETKPVEQKPAESKPAKKPAKMPQTGINVASYVAIAGTVIVLAVAGVVLVKKYTK